MKNGAKGIIAILLAGVLAAGVCCTGYASRGDDGKWFKNGDLKTWHWNEEKKPDVPTPPTDGDGEDSGGLVVGESEGNGVEVCSAILPRAAFAANGVSAQADSAYVLTATVGSNNDGENTGVKWSMEWENPSSEWAAPFATQVTEFVTLTPGGSDHERSKTATLSCINAFSEPIIVTAKLKEKEELSAQCKLDYLQRVTDFSLTLGEGDTAVECSFYDGVTMVPVETNNSGTPVGGKPTLNLVQTDGTLEAEIQTEYDLFIPGGTNGGNQADYWMRAYRNGTFYEVRFFDYDNEYRGNVSDSNRTEVFGTRTYSVFNNYAKTQFAEKGIVFSVLYFYQNMGLNCSLGQHDDFPFRRCASEGIDDSKFFYSDADLFVPGLMKKLHDKNIGSSWAQTDYSIDSMFHLTVRVGYGYNGEERGYVKYSTEFKSSNITNTSKLTSVDLDKSNIIM